MDQLYVLLMTHVYMFRTKNIMNAIDKMNEELD